MTLGQPLTMWAIQHVSSGSWDNGQANLKLYYFEHECRLACRQACADSSAFQPIKVFVKVATEPQ